MTQLHFYLILQAFCRDKDRTKIIRFSPRFSDCLWSKRVCIKCFSLVFSHGTPIEPFLIYYWSTIYEAGPTLTQRFPTAGQFSVQNQNVVSAYLKSEQLLLFGFADQYLLISYTLVTCQCVYTRREDGVHTRPRVSY